VKPSVPNGSAAAVNPWCTQRGCPAGCPWACPGERACARHRDPGHRAHLGTELALIVAYTGRKRHHAPQEKHFHIYIYAAGASGASRPRSSMPSRGARLRNRSWAISRTSTEWTAAISPDAPAMPSMPCWPPAPAISGSRSRGWPPCGPGSLLDLPPLQAARHGLSRLDRPYSGRIPRMPNSSPAGQASAQVRLVFRLATKGILHKPAD
jgi:hypothetical protein